MALQASVDKYRYFLIFEINFLLFGMHFQIFEIQNEINEFQIKEHSVKIMLQHSTHFTFLIYLQDQNTVNRNEYEILKETIVNIIKEKFSDERRFWKENV